LATKARALRRENGSERLSDQVEENQKKHAGSEKAATSRTVLFTANRRPGGCALFEGVERKSLNINASKHAAYYYCRYSEPFAVRKHADTALQDVSATELFLRAASLRFPFTASSIGYSVSCRLHFAQPGPCILWNQSLESVCGAALRSPALLEDLEFVARQNSRYY
jgi:hypothetical protein